MSDQNVHSKLNEEKGSSLWWIIPVVLGILVVVHLNKRMDDFDRKVNHMGGGGALFNKNKSVDLPSFSKVKFEDIAGVDEAKKELEEIIDFLKNPNKFIRVGAKIPKGVLLLGRPGTGKTLLAKALASEAGVPFFSMSGSEFVEVYVGVGASRVRSLFENAKKQSPAIIFIDEIDAVARKRSSSSMSGSMENEQTLNQLLVEMDGFDNKSNVIVIAATNRPDVLDHALTRPGRFDRQVVVNAPSLKGREEILKVHAKGKVLDRDVNLNTIARKTPGFVGADLANVLNEAAILAARDERRSISSSDIEEAVERVISGPESKSMVLNEKEKKMVAFHEAGHALVAYLLPNTDPVHTISIIPRGYGNLGYTLQLPLEDTYSTSREQLLDKLKVLMGGRAAEEVIFGEVTSGAGSDIEKATKIARAMVESYGMSESLGPRAIIRDGNINHGEKMAQMIDEEISYLVRESYIEAKRMLAENRGKLKKLARELLDKEVLSGDDMKRLLKN